MASANLVQSHMYLKCQEFQSNLAGGMVNDLMYGVEEILESNLE